MGWESVLDYRTNVPSSYFISPSMKALHLVPETQWILEDWTHACVLRQSSNEFNFTRQRLVKASVHACAGLMGVWWSMQMQLNLWQRRAKKSWVNQRNGCQFCTERHSIRIRSSIPSENAKGPQSASRKTDNLGAKTRQLSSAGNGARLRGRLTKLTSLFSLERRILLSIRGLQSIICGQQVSAGVGYGLWRLQSRAQNTWSREHHNKQWSEYVSFCKTTLS